MKRPFSTNIKRRVVLQGMGGAIGALALGCGSGPADQTLAGGEQAAATGAGGAGGAGEGSGGGNGGAGGSGPPDICGETSGLSALELLEPIENIVVLCMENRSFDHYLGSLLLAEGKA